MPMHVIGTQQMDSMRIAAEYPASASEPKPLTTACTSIMPMDTVDCCKMDGSAIIAMRRASPPLNSPVLPQLRLRSSRRNTANDSTADSPCAMSVAHAAPATPQPYRRTNTRSSTTLRMDEKMRKYSGMRDFPSALNMDETMLYMNRNGRPMK